MARLRNILPGTPPNEFCEFDTLDGRSIRVCRARTLSIVLSEAQYPQAMTVEPIWAPPPEVYRAAGEWRDDEDSFEANTMPVKRRSLELIAAYGWNQDEETRTEYLHVTKLYHDDGRCLRINAEVESLYDFAFRRVL